MRKITLAVMSAATLTCGPALAADLRMPVKAPAAVVEQAFNWSGFYIGVMGGGGWSHNRWQFDNTPGINTNHKGSGGFVGGTIGYNFQSPGSAFVFGVEADGAWADIRGTTDCPNPAFRCRHTIDTLASFRGRVGWAAGPALFYGTGGLGYGSINHRSFDAATGATFGTFRQDAWGWTAGGGVEFAFGGNWSAKIEYLHYDFERATAPAGTIGGGAASLRTNVDTVKAGINYRFGWDGPVVARY